MIARRKDMSVCLLADNFRGWLADPHAGMTHHRGGSGTRTKKIPTPALDRVES
jgi:hypothetical protein